MTRLIVGRRGGSLGTYVWDLNTRLEPFRFPLVVYYYILLLSFNLLQLQLVR